MGNRFRNCLLLCRRWGGIVIAGVLIYGGTAYLISAFLRPVYQASTYLLICVGAPSHPSVTESLQAVPTFVQLITIPAVLNPVVEQHPGMSLQELLTMIAVRPQSKTQIIELDVQADDPLLAAELAKQISQSFSDYANASAPGTVQIIMANAPALPAQPRSLQAAGLGAATGLLLMCSLILFFGRISNQAGKTVQDQKVGQRDAAQCVLEGVPYTTHPTLIMKSIASSAPLIEVEESYLPDTGKNEQVGSIPSKPLVRPLISLCDLMLPANGLTGRTFRRDIATPFPPSLQTESRL